MVPLQVPLFSIEYPAQHQQTCTMNAAEDHPWDAIVYWKKAPANAAKQVVLCFTWPKELP